MTGQPPPLAARPDEPELAGPYRKDADQETFLAALNAQLAGFETDRYTPLDETLPTLHVIGAPRSGTTLLHQVIATGLEVQSVTNLVAAFWRAPVTGIRLARALNVQAVDSSFTSTFGRTAGLVEPHEFGYFWNHHLRYPDLAERDPGHEATIAWDHLAQVIRNMAAAAGAPVTFKPMLLTWHLERMVQAMPRTCYVWIRRDRVATAVSLLGMRRSLFGSDARWASLQPAGIAADAPPWRQVAEQVVAIENRIALAAQRLGPERVLEVSYDALCADPGTVIDQVRELLGAHGHAPAVRPHALGPFAADPSETLAAEYGDRVAAALAELRDLIGRVVAPLVNPNEPEAQVTELHAEPYTEVRAGQHVATLETSKATAEVDCEFDGWTGPVAVAVGGRVAAGDLLFEVFAERPDPAAAPAAPDTGGRRATKKAEALAAELLGVDLGAIPGTGFITEADVRAAAPAPEIEVAPGSLLLFGGGGLARTIIDLAHALRREVAGIVDDGLAPGTDMAGVPVLGPGSALTGLTDVEVVNAVGAIGRMSVRRAVSARIAAAGLVGPVLVDPSASVAVTAELAPGVVVFAQATVSAAAVVEANTLVNTGAIVSHDCRIGADAHIAPGAILAGEVTVGDGALVGMAVTAPVGLTIGANAVVGNGATLLADVPPDAVVPAGTIWPAA